MSVYDHEIVQEQGNKPIHKYAENVHTFSKLV